MKSAALASANAGERTRIQPNSSEPGRTLPRTPPQVWFLWSRNRDENPVATISHRSALHLFKFENCSAPNIHITVPPAFRRNTRPTAAVVLHRASLNPEDVTDKRGLKVCRPLRALLDMAQVEPDSANEIKSLAEEARYRGLKMERDVIEMKKRENLPRFLSRLLG